MNLYDVIISLHEQLIEAHKIGDCDSADNLFTVFSHLLDICYIKGDEKQIEILVDMLDTARDIVGDVKWKSEIPTIEGIQEAFLSAQDTSENEAI